MSNTPRNKIRLLVAEDDVSVRQGYVSMLEDEDDLKIVGEAGCAKTAVEASLSLRPEVILMDLAMPAQNEELVGGIEAVAEICTRWPEAKILVLTNHSGDELIYRAMRKGALGYLLKRSLFDEVLLAIRTVAQGKTYMSGEVLNKLRERIFNDGIDQLLTDKETALMRLTARGVELEEAADVLNISVSTAKACWASVTAKLKARGKFQAISNARERGFI